MSTYMAKAGQVDRKWYVIDAAGKPLGRVAAQAAVLLRGKHKPTKAVRYDTLMRTKPEKAMELAVHGMIPSNTIGRAAEARLRVYAGSEHKHEAQKPTAWEL